MKTKILLFLTVLLLCSWNLLAQYRINGRISDQNKAVISTVSVLVEENGKYALSDENGTYSIENLKPGTYHLIFQHLSYKDVRKEVIVESNTKLDIVMEEKVIQYPSFTITSTRAGENTPGSYTNLEKSEIQSLNLGQDLPYLLEYTPSVVSTSDAGAGIGYTGIRIRGTDITRINVTVNGIPLNDAESQGVFWVNMPDFSSSVENIQIQRGVGTSTNGAAAFGSSINIETAAPSPKSFAIIDNSFGSFNTMKNNIEIGSGLIKNRFFFNARLSKIYSDGYIDRAFSDLKSFYLSGGMITKKHQLKILVFSGKEKTYQAWYGVPKDSLETNRQYNPYEYENQTDNYQQDHYQLHYSFIPNETWKFQTALHYTKGKGYYEEYKDDQDFSDYALENLIIGGDTINQTDIIRQLHLDNDFFGITYAAMYSNNRLEFNLGGAANQYIGDHFGEIVWAEYMSNGDYRHNWYNNQGKKTDINVYAKLNYALSEKFNLYLDVQQRIVDYSIKGIHRDFRDLTQEHHFNFFNPKAGIIYQWNKKQRAYFAFAVANREPNRSNYRDADDNYEPRPEQLFDYELGYNFYSKKFQLNTTVFYMDYKDQLVLTGEINDVGAAIMTNVENSFRSGIEIATAYHFTEKFLAEANCSFSQNKIKNYTQYVDNWDDWSQEKTALGTTDIAFSPNIIANAIFSYNVFKDAKISLLNKYVGKQYIDNSSDENNILDAYFLNNLRLEYGFNVKNYCKLKFNFLINNIFDVKYETNAWLYRYIYGGEEYVMDGYFPQAGRNYLIGVRLEF